MAITSCFYAWKLIDMQNCLDWQWQYRIEDLSMQSQGAISRNHWSSLVSAKPLPPARHGKALATARRRLAQPGPHRDAPDPLRRLCRQNGLKTDTETLRSTPYIHILLTIFSSCLRRLFSLPWQSIILRKHLYQKTNLYIRLFLNCNLFFRIRKERN